jgi:RHS repeat-associated protein
MLSLSFLKFHSLLIAPALLSLLIWTHPKTWNNQPPVANPDHYTVHGSFATPLDSEPYGVLKNDSDPDGDFLSCDFAIVNTSLGTALIFPNGRVVFTAASGRTGSVTVPYTVCDNHGFCAESTVTFDVTNEAPVAGSDEYTVHGIFDTGGVNPPPFGVLKNDSDPEGDTLSCLEKRVDTALGTALIFPSGQATFVQNANGQTGDVSFNYTVCDNLGACSEGNVTFHIVNNAPVAVDDTYIVRDPVFSSPQNSPPFGPLKNDSDPQGDSIQIDFNRVDFAQGTGFVFPIGDLYPNGRADFVRNNNYLNFTGELTMPYTLRDSLGATSQGTVTFLLIGQGENNGACGRCNETVGGPVKVSTGNMYLQQNDYHLPGVGHAISLSRTYNSNSQAVGLFGRGWSTQYDEAIASYDASLLSFTQGDGRAIYFSRPVTSSGAFSDLIGDYHARVTQDSGGGVLTLNGGDTKRFNSAGKLVSLADRNGNTTKLVYDGNGVLTSVTDPFGRVLTINTNAYGQATSISDSIGVIATYAYGSSNELLSVTYADNSSFNFTYDGSLRLTTVTDALGNILEAHSYDAQGRAITSERQGGIDHFSLDYVSDTETDVTDGLGHVTKYTFDKSKGRHVVTRVEGLCSCGGGGGSQVQTWEYDDQLNVTSMTDSLNHSTSYTYDSNGNQLTETDPTGTVAYTYNNFGGVLTRTNQLNGVTTYAYDGLGNLLTTTNALDKTTSVSYDTHGLPLTVTDARNKTATFAYDAAGNLITRTDALNHSTQFAYDARGRLASTTNALGHVATFSYDALGRVKVVTRADGTTTSYEYDLAGRRTAVTDAKGNRSTYEYDGDYRLVSQADAANQTTRYDYDVMSNLTRVTDPLSRVTNYEYDEFNRLVKTTYPAATPGADRLFETVTYDGVGNVAQRTDTAGRLTSYVYDEMNRVVSATDAAEQTTNFEYDALSRMTALVDAIGQRYRFNYDALGRLKKLHRGQDVMSFTYDPVGNRKTRMDYNGVVTDYTYDALNRLKTISYPDTTTVSYTYDKLSRLQTATNENGIVNFDYNKMNRVTTVTDVFGQVVEYNYDANGNRAKLSLNSAIVASYKYDAVDRLTKILDAAGAAFTFDYDATNKLTQKKAPNGVKTTYQFDGLNRLTRLQDTKGVNTIADRQYQYNTASQITQIAEPASTRSYGYDDIDRLTAASYTNPLQPNENYTYDRVGNRTTSQLSVSYTYQRFNRLTNTSTANYSYDLNGNLISKTDSTGTTQYAWDFENRLRQVSLPNGMTVSYKYDALGRRIQRTPSNGVSTNFVYDGQDVVKDLNSDGSTVDYLNGLGVDNKLRLTDSRLAGPLYFVQDHLGSTTGLTNSSGTIVAQISYDSFGNPGTGTNLTRYTYTGREFDADSGLYYYRARWYDAKVGRFISEDPIGFGGGVNQFRYVGNNPQNFVDPAGLYNEDVHYYLTYFIASRFPCLSSDEARLIADADQSTDENPNSSPGPGFGITPVAWTPFTDRFAQDKNAVFHTFNPGNNAFLKERWTVACSGNANYVGLGRLLHYIQDSFSHRGFYSPAYGQLFGGYAVDDTNNDVGKASDMASATWFAIRDWIKAKKCKCGDQGDTEVHKWWPQVTAFLETDNDEKEKKRQILDVPRR